MKSLFRIGAKLAAGIGISVTGCQSMSESRPRAATPAVSIQPAKHVSVQAGEVVAASAVEPKQASPSDPTVPPAAPLAPTPTVIPIDLGGALAAAGIDNPTIALARERMAESAARRTAARALLLPNLTGGLNFHLHRGNLQRSPGTILNVESQSVYIGAGARTLAAETVAFPGVRLFAHLGDAALEPRAADQRLTARTADAQAVRNRTLLDVATAYLELVGANSRVAALKMGEAEMAELARLTETYAKAGEGRNADADRAAANRDLLARLRVDAEGEATVAAARLAGLLSLDPAARLTPPVAQPEPVSLVDEQADLDGLLALGLASRPERRTRAAEVGEARTRVRQEQVRPWLPTVSVGLSAGGFGGGSNLVPSSFGPFSTRTDFDVWAVWTVQNLGFGNRALQRQASARYGQAVAESVRTDNEIRREIGEAVAAARAARAQLDAARNAQAAAQEGAAEELKRIRGTVGRPLEALDSARQLTESRLELIRAITEFNVAQFRLWVAVGGSPGTTANQRASR